ncbi:hypothetical protein [Streptomyces sp. NPDC060194]|uniref:hypothetical protein n=1 Tax=Streptomyces sp. NPDC060194 TaxID=3347069 RepID=UPI0036553EFE
MSDAASESVALWRGDPITPEEAGLRAGWCDLHRGPAETTQPVLAAAVPDEEPVRRMACERCRRQDDLVLRRGGGMPGSGPIKHVYRLAAVHAAEAGR